MPRELTNCDLRTAADFEQAHARQSEHAFDCLAVFREAYEEARADGARLYVCYSRAVRQHQSRVDWCKENVGLD